MLNVRLVTSSTSKRRITSAAMGSNLNRCAIEISPRTVSNQLVEKVIFSGNALQMPWIRKSNARRRLEWPLQYTIGQWKIAKNVIWSDEAHFRFSKWNPIKLLSGAHVRSCTQIVCSIPSNTSGKNYIRWCFCSQGVGPLRLIKRVMDHHVFRNILIQESALVLKSRRLVTFRTIMTMSILRSRWSST